MLPTRIDFTFVDNMFGSLGLLRSRRDFFYASAFGFQVEQVSDLTTGSRTTAQYLLTQGNIRFILETALTSDHPVAEECRKFGDGVKDVALTVLDAERAWEQARRNGGESAYEPRTISDANGSVTAQCTALTPYNIALSAGSNAGTANDVTSPSLLGEGRAPAQR